jgi:7-cyano-7-deazaguanine synthase in queuosine biosynthesis
MDKEKVLLLYSGGFDSTVLLLDLIKQDLDVHVMYLEFKQENLVGELNAMNFWVQKYTLTNILRSVPMFKGDGEYVHMRNLILASYGMAYAEKKGIQKVYMGLVANEGVTAYPDTTPMFEKLMSSMGEHLAGIDFIAPYVTMSKTELFAYASNMFPEEIDLILEKSFSCNFPVDYKPCGICGDCKHIEAYKKYKEENLEK